MPNHKPVHKLPYIYKPEQPFCGSDVYVVCQSTDPRVMGYIAHSLEKQDIEYFIHAGNAYPKMVEMLRRINLYYDNYVELRIYPIEESLLLLKEIGEAE